jgi:hypothetical protein
MSHTPGPWTFQDDATFSTLGDKRIVGADRISPAIVFGGISESAANAALIAAAPELLLALDLILGIGRKDHGNPKYDGIYATARAAIAKAEGR